MDTPGLTEFVLLLTLGGVLIILAALLANGVKVKAVEVPRARWYYPLLCALLGLGIVGIALYTRFRDPPPKVLSGPGLVVQQKRLAFKYDPNTKRYSGAKTNTSAKNSHEFTAHVSFARPGFSSPPTVLFSVVELPESPSHWSVGTLYIERDGFDLVVKQTDGSPARAIDILWTAIGMPEQSSPVVETPKATTSRP